MGRGCLCFADLSVAKVLLLVCTYLDCPVKRRLGEEARGKPRPELRLGVGAVASGEVVTGVTTATAVWRRRRGGGGRSGRKKNGEVDSSGDQISDHVQSARGTSAFR